MQPFPTDILGDCCDALMLFCAAFSGENDCRHVADAGLEWVVCVDNDAAKLGAMIPDYPATWVYTPMDAFRFAGHAREDEQRWDLVCADPFTGDALDGVLAGLDAFGKISARYLVVTLDVASHPCWPVPDGFRQRQLVHRARSIYWLVLERV